MDSVASLFQELFIELNMVHHSITSKKEYNNLEQRLIKIRMENLVCIRLLTSI